MHTNHTHCLPYCSSHAPSVSTKCQLTDYYKTQGVTTSAHFLFRMAIQLPGSVNGDCNTWQQDIAFHAGDFRQAANDAQHKRMRRPGIEPGASRWQRDILPLNQRRSHTHNIKHTIQQQPRTHTKQQTLSSTLLISHFAAFDQLSDSSHDQPLSVSWRQISVSRRQI